MNHRNNSTHQVTTRHIDGQIVRSCTCGGSEIDGGASSRLAVKLWELAHDENEIIAATAHRALDLHYVAPAEATPASRTSIGHIMAGTAGEAVDFLRAAGLV